MQVFQPLSNLQFQLRSAWMQNPVFQAKRMAIGMRAQAGYLLNQPRHYMRMIVPSGTLGRLKIPGFSGKFGKFGKIENPLDDVRGAFGKKDEMGQGRRYRGIPMRAQFSQIHLIEPLENVRHVLHIGTVVGQSASDIKLEHPKHKTIRIRFAQADPRQYQGAPMLLTYLSGDETLEVDGNFTQGSVPIRNFASLAVGGIDYQIELFAYDRLPEITRVDAGWATNPGPRTNNEDAVGIYQHKDAYMFVVADGVGSGDAADEISAFATQYMLSAFERNLKRFVPWPDTLHKAYAYINAEVRNFITKTPRGLGGTTLTTVVIKNWQAYVGHIGDSVLYLYRNYYLERITDDHGEDDQEVGYETAEKDGKTDQPVTRNMLGKAIGKANTIKPDVLNLQLQPGDCLLLCSDGVSDYIPRNHADKAALVEKASTEAEKERIRQLPCIIDVLENMPQGTAAKRLVTLAHEYGTGDNVSAIVVRVLDDAYERDSWTALPENRVYVNGYFAPVPRLKITRELQTFYKLATSWGCLVILLSLCASASLFGFYRLYIDPVPLPTSTPTAEPTIAVTEEEVEVTEEATATRRATNDDQEEIENTAQPSNETEEADEATAIREPTDTREPTQETQPTLAPTIVEPTGRPTLVRPTSTLRPPRR